MKKVKIIAGIIWAFLCLILILVLFPGINAFSSSLAKLPFMKINPNYSGGEIAYENVHEGCTLVTREAVFNGLIKERKRGFVQVDWRGDIPEEIIDTIDYDLNNMPDFVIRIDTRTSDTEIDPISTTVTGLDVSTRTSYGWAARIELKKQKE